MNLLGVKAFLFVLGWLHCAAYEGKIDILSLMCD